MIAGSNQGASPLFNISSSMPTAPVRKSGADEFLNSENNKNDYDWYVVPLNCHNPYILFIMFIFTVFIRNMIDGGFVLLVGQTIIDL
jgi:hypothetical protein